MLGAYKAALNCNANGTVPGKQKAHPHLAHPMSWPCHCPCPCPVQVTVAVTELIIRMVLCMSRHAQPGLNFILS